MYPKNLTLMKIPLLKIIIWSTQAIINKKIYDSQATWNFGKPEKTERIINRTKSTFSHSDLKKFFETGIKAETKNRELHFSFTTAER